MASNEDAIRLGVICSGINWDSLPSDKEECRKWFENEWEQFECGFGEAITLKQNLVLGPALVCPSCFVMKVPIEDFKDIVQLHQTYMGEIGKGKRTSCIRCRNILLSSRKTEDCVKCSQTKELLKLVAEEKFFNTQ